jgi:ribosomal-protein-serine acetyltransferase
MITAGNFLLRPYTDADASSMSAAVRESSPSMQQWMPWAKSDFSDCDALCWFAACTTERVAGSAHNFGIFTLAGEYVGGCGVNQISPKNNLCNLGYWVSPLHRRRGAATAATLALRDFAFTSLALTRIEIVVAADNAIGLAFARRVGATHECLARNRIHLHGRPVDAHVFSFVPEAKA